MRRVIVKLKKRTREENKNSKEVRIHKRGEQENNESWSGKGDPHKMTNLICHFLFSICTNFLLIHLSTRLEKSEGDPCDHQSLIFIILDYFIPQKKKKKYYLNYLSIQI